MLHLRFIRAMSITRSRADLCVQTKLNIIADWVTNLNISLIYSVISINELGNVEADIVNLVLALDLSDLNGLGDADLSWGWVGEGARDLKRVGHKWDLVSLGLVFLMAHLVFSLTISLMSISISSRSTSCDFHGLRLVLISDLGGGAWSGDIFLLVNVGTDLSVNSDGSLLADGQNSVKAVVIVNNLLDSQGDRGHSLIKTRCTDFSLNGCVGISTQKFWSISVSMRLDGLVCSNS